MSDLNKLITDMIKNASQKSVKKVTAKVISVDDSNMITVSITGTNTQVTLPNKTGERLHAGESVHVHYWGNITSGYVAVRNGTPNCAGEDLGNHNERFNDYTNNTATDATAYNTLKGSNNQVTQGAAYNLLAGKYNSMEGGADSNFMIGNHNYSGANSHNNIISGNNNTTYGDAQDNIIGGSENNISGGSHRNLFIGYENDVNWNGGADNNIVGGYHNGFADGSHNDNLVVGAYNVLNAGSSENMVCGSSNTLQSGGNQASQRNIVGGDYNAIYQDNSIVCGADNVVAERGALIFGVGNIAGAYALAGGTNCVAALKCLAIGGSCRAGVSFSGIPNNGTHTDRYNSYINYDDSSEIYGEGSAAIGLGIEILHSNRFGCGRDNLYNATAIFQIGIGAGNVKANGFEVDFSGNVHAAGQYGSIGADYAEYYEWLDGNENNEDRVGLFVTLKGSKIIPANADEEYILGVISATPTVCGDNDIGYWRGRYETDIFGRIIYEDKEITREKIIDGETKKITETVRAPKLSKEYNGNEKYIPRSERSEWSPVGTHGKLIVIDDGTCKVDGYCKPANGGIATSSEMSNNSYRVIERLDTNHIRIVIK